MVGQWWGQGSLLRNGVAGGVATAADFAFVSLLVSATPASMPVATFWGCAVGAVVNFYVNRYWAFASRLAYGQALFRYAVVSAASAVLNSGLVAVLLWLTSASDAVGWVAARALVFVGWNYPLHRLWVFPAGSHTGRTARR